ncbi:MULTISPECIES: peptidoglycan-binding domain-containing protein [unclassified Leptolyngbya]|uniref:peptidoglycan-binding domain-containing protein n=1 Tax=unclassified Leptolyngbya TaxID=2650499 RepID=UPI001685A6A6|nr:MULTISPECIES: peptidoglycan-binding domain-containing protein [unclassified Leptolyngbya]MBD1912556.1 peptidoglycan-binding protein [Leptolyngbya sp. FACHB-8]MBD2154909.1 peptidoglycan-binding protein [Leptolyngbya sp. FACHB-16]
MQASAPNTRPEILCHQLPILRRNDQQKRADENIKVLQRLLNGYNFKLQVDGFFGAKTEAAVMTYQERGNDHNPYMLVDGIVGPQTWESLGACIIVGC